MRMISGRLLVALWLASVFVTIILVRCAHEHVMVPFWLIALAGGGALLIGALRIRSDRTASPLRRALREFAEHAGLLVGMALVGAVASYPAAAAGTGYADPALAHADQLLGFDWDGWYRMVAMHPPLQAIGRAAYQSIFVSPLILLGYYAARGRSAEARSFLLAFWIAAAATLLLFPHFAAIGPLAYSWHGPIPYMPVSALDQMEIIPGLRSHAIAAIDPTKLRGLVEAPSFHAASAVLYAGFAWRERPLRWPFAFMNAAMLLATPVEGTHYLTDLLLGAIVAVGAIAAARLVDRIGAVAIDPHTRGLRLARDAA